MINEAQSRMARAVLKISVRELAKLAKASTDTVVRLERGEELKERTADAIQSVFEGSGLVKLHGDYIAVSVPFAELDAKVTDWKQKVGLVSESSETAGELTKQIDAIGKELAETDHDVPASPAKGMQQLEDAHKADKAVKLENKRTKIERK